MAVSFFIEEHLIPDDGSKECIMNVQNQYPDADIAIFPDVHYKEGAKVVNGMLTSHRDRIIPEMLGVENCGFLFASLAHPLLEEKILLETAKSWSLEVKDYSRDETTPIDQAIELVMDYFRNNFIEYESTLQFLNLSDEEEFREAIRSLFSNRYMQKALSRGLGTLGGGNHFFELMYDNDGNYYAAIHSDSVLFGERVNNVCSNLNEIQHNKWYLRIVKSFRIRLAQLFLLLPFVRNVNDLKGFFHLCYSFSGDRSISIKSNIGKRIIFLYMVANAIGALNRLKLLDVFSQKAAEMLGEHIVVELVSNFAHDKLELIDENNIVQRNGVQKVGVAQFYMPGALGTPAYLMRGMDNEAAFNSCNHGVGRLVPKSRVGNDNNSESSITILRVGSSELGVQRSKYFKDVKEVVHQMAKFGLAQSVKVLQPILSIKG